MERIKATVEDDVTYQRIKLLPKRSHHYSVHRRLSWQYQRDVQQFERDAKLVTFEVSRGQTAVRDRLSQLNKTKRELQSKQVNDTKESPGANLAYRRRSCPILETHNISANSVEDKEDLDNDTIATDSRRILHRSDTVEESRDRDLLLAIRRFTSPNIKAYRKEDTTVNPEKVEVIQEA